MMDLTYSNYEKILIELKNKKNIIIKHDIECVSSNTYELAKRESYYGIRAYYFYQFDVFTKSVDEIRRISGLGHLIGYHYDVLDNNNGNIESAINEFSENLIYFNKKGFNISWICPHGNPSLNRNGWHSNKDFFRSNRVRSSFPQLKDIVVDKEIHFPDYKYISDAGYGFKIISSVSDNDCISSQDKEVDILQFLTNNNEGGLILSTHSHRWCSNVFLFKYKKLLFVFLKSFFHLTKSIPIMKIFYNITFKYARKF